MLPETLRHWIARGLSHPPAGPRQRRRSACLLASGRIGDFVLQLSLVRLLTQHFGPADCTLVLPPILAPLAAAEFPGVELIPLPLEAASLTRELIPMWWRERRNCLVGALCRVPTWPGRAGSVSGTGWAASLGN